MAEQIQKATINKNHNTTTKNLVLIGVGQLGSRYLQGLKKVFFPCNIQLIEPNLRPLKNYCISQSSLSLP